MLNPFQASVALAMISRIAERGLQGAGAFDIKASVVRIGHADPAVQLDHLAADRVGKIIGRSLG